MGLTFFGLVFVCGGFVCFLFGGVFVLVFLIIANAQDFLVDTALGSLPFFTSKGPLPELLLNFFHYES